MVYLTEDSYPNPPVIEVAWEIRFQDNTIRSIELSNYTFEPLTLKKWIIRVFPTIFAEFKEFCNIQLTAENMEYFKSPGIQNC